MQPCGKLRFWIYGFLRFFAIAMLLVGGMYVSVDVVCAFRAAGIVFSNDLLIAHTSLCAELLMP